MSFDSLNGMEFLGAHLKFKVPGFKAGTDGTYHYAIQLSYTLKEPYKRQDLSYTYQFCLGLAESLNKQCPDLPVLSLASKYGFKPSAYEIEKRRIELEKWLMAITWRCDVLATREFQDFCNLKSLLQEDWLDQPQPQVELDEGHLFPVSDFVYEPEQQVCFVATSDTQPAAKLKGLVSMFTGGMLKQTGPNKAQVLCYRLDVDKNGKPVTTQLWRNTYVNKVSRLHWDEKLTILVVGFDTGQVLVLRVSTEKGYKETTEYGFYVKHTDIITGLATNALTGQLYSVSRDRTFITLDLSNPNNVIKDKEFAHELTFMLQQRSERRLMISDSFGNVFIFRYDSGTLDPAHQIKPLQKMNITCMQIYHKRNYLITGSAEGLIMVYDIGSNGKERSTSLVSQIQTIPNLRSVVFSGSTKEIYVNYNNNILVIESQKLKNLYSFKAHEGGVQKMQLFDDIGLIVTGGKDQSLRFWQYKDLPHKIMDIEMMQFRPDPEQKQTQKKPEIEAPQELTQKMQQKQLEDLDGWND